MKIGKTLNVFLVLAILFAPLSPLFPIRLEAVAQDIRNAHNQENVLATNLFRVHVGWRNEYQLQKLNELSPVFLDEGDYKATLLVNEGQLEKIGRLGFVVIAADELGLLIRRSLDPSNELLQSFQLLIQQSSRVKKLETSSSPEERAMSVLERARQDLQVTIDSLTQEQRSMLNALLSVDDDADGLTNTEEVWWCTDPLNPNSDGDAQGYTDGQEVHALLDFTLPRNVRWGYGPPFGPPNAWPNFNDRNGTHVNVCNDGDWDTIPDYAEVYMVGTRVPEESTDRDKFDDGQELFGITFCPGAPTNCGYGSYPAVEYWNFIQARVPDWVLPPGDSPLVAAFPVPEVYVTPGSWRVERVTTITTSEGQMTQTSHTYETSVTRGQSSSIADTVTWNNWEEVSHAIETPLAAAALSASSVQACEPAGSLKCRVWGGVKIVGGILGLGLAGLACTSFVGCAVGGVAAVPLSKLVEGGWSDLTNKNQVQTNYPINTYKNTNVANASASAQAQASATVVNNIDFQGVVNSLDGVQYAINRQGELLARGLYDISYQLSRPRYTETRTNGHSWGGSQTTTHEEYEEHTIAEGQAFTTGQNWSTAWAVDSSHAADLTFEFTVKNTGTEYARELTGIVINVYIGDDTSPAISYPAWQKFPNGKLENLFPVGPNTPPGQFSTRTFRTDPIPLTLEQMKRIDLGERLTVKVESYSFGADELFYRNAVQGGVTVFIEDGVDDGDESVDSYVIPTWGVESVQDVLTRYFPAGYDAEGNLNALWTPEFDGVNPPTWREHYLSDIAWWNVYFTQADAGDTPLKDLPAQAGSAILFRFNRDSDRDGYNDRAEFRYYCSLPQDQAHPDHVYCADAHLRPEVHPQPEVAAGYVAERNGNVVTVKLAVANTGTFDAYGIDAVMYSPDDTTTVGNNTVGGNGRVRPGHQVAVGSLIKPPDLSNWGASTAKPYAGGQFSGAADRTFTFTAETAGVVGQGNTSVRWSDGAGGEGMIPLGSSYHAPLPVDVAQGLQVGFNTGTIAPGARFTVQALTPRDTFTYTINSEPYTPPVIVVSYSDPQGSHRFVTPVELPRLDAAIPAGQMLEGLKLDIVTPAAFNPSGANTTHLVVNSPHPATIQGGHLYLNFVSDGKLVLEKAYTLDIPPGPTVFPAEWSTTEFSADYHPDGDNLLIAFWTDSEGNIIDSAARPLSSFQEDPRPSSAMEEDDEVWDFGTVARGTLLRRTIAIGSVGLGDLLSYVESVPGLSVSGTGNRRLPPADIALYDLNLNTADLPEGPFERMLTIRTSDPEHPTRTLTVRGMIAAYTPDTPPGSVQRPLDWSVAIPGDHTQGEWVEFVHTLSPDPQTLHPVKVYSQDYGTLWGVGKYATVFGQGTASYDMFGDGRDGVMPSSGNLDYDNGVGAGIVNGGNAGSHYINVTDAYAIWRINPGDMVLIHQTQGSGAGCWELNKAVSDFGGGTATYQLEKPLQCNYSSDSNNHAQIQRVPQYTDCPVTGTVTPLAAWNGIWGGIFAVMCNGTMNLTGRISAGGLGFRGGSSSQQGEWSQTGEGISGPGLWQNTANLNGGGGAQQTCEGGPGGGGGGYGTPGNPGHYGLTSRLPGPGGESVGLPTLETIHLGGGGGGGARSFSNPGGIGGAGGGAVVILGKYLILNGEVDSSGGAGAPGISNALPPENQRGYPGGGGGGAGGSVLIRGAVVQINPDNVKALGGAEGASSGGGDVVDWCGPGYALSGAGGSGGVGRIRIEYCESFAGTTNPPASVQKLNCYIAEQIESTPYDRGRLNLPETFSNGRTYQVQYGRRFVFGTAGEQTAVLRVPAGAFTNAMLDALVSEVGSGSLTFRLDIGNDGSWDWEYTGNVENAATLNSPNLAAAFNRYWAANRAPNSGTLDVPVKVSLNKGGQVLLTNLQITPSGSKMRYVRLLAHPYDNATVSFVVNNDVPNPEPLTIAADVGNDGTVDWVWSGSPTYPARLTTANLSAAVNAYLSGRSGEVDVPIRFYVPPFVSLVLADFNVTPTARPNLTLVASDISFGAASPTEGDNVTVTATLHNTGLLDSGSIIAAFYVLQNGQSLWNIGSALVPNIPAGGTAQASISWNTLGFTGSVPVRVIIDPYDRVAEISEENNQATASLTIRTRPDLQVTKVALSDDEPNAGETVTVNLTLRNHGQTTAGAQTVVLYQGNPDAGGLVIGTRSLASLAGGSETNIAFNWRPTKPGAHRLFARVDRENVINESDEGNNDTWRDVYVGLASPVLLDSGSSSDVAYSPEQGYGFIDEGQPDQLSACGSLPYQTIRRDPNGKLIYRFDHLLPSHFYHLDLLLFECDNAGRAERVYVDGFAVSDVIDLSDGRVHSLSLRLDPALYNRTEDRSILVSIEAGGFDGAVVAAINLYDIDYRYADSGGSQDPQYPSGTPKPYGWLDGVANLSGGNLPYQSVRVDQSDNSLRYRFDQLDARKSYQLNLTFWQPSGTPARIQTVQIDGIDAGTTVNSGDYEIHRVSLNLPKNAYTDDSSILVNILRTNGSTGAFINEIALEEVTLDQTTLPPIADFVASPLSGYAPLAVQFTNRSSGAITSYQWDFGDGSTDTTPNPIHTYINPGTYSVRLRAIGPGGEGTKTISNYITVNSISPTTTMVQISPASSSGGVSIPLTVTVGVANVTNLGSFQFTLRYDPTKVNVQGMRLAEFPSSTGRVFTPIGPSIDNVNGQASFGAYSTGATPLGVNGSGGLAYVRLMPMSGGTTTLQLEGVQVVNANGTAVDVITQNGFLQINACVGDFDQDGDVDILDVQRVAYRWNSRSGQPLYEAQYDIDQDGDIDILDLQTVAYRWGSRCNLTTTQVAAPTSSEATAALAIEPAEGTVTVNEVFTRSVVITNAEDLGAFEFTLQYDKDLLQVRKVTLGSFPGSTGRTFTALEPVIDAVSGKVTFGAYSIGSTPNGPNGQGVLALIEFQALAEGSSTLQLEHAQIVTRTGLSQPVQSLMPVTLTILPARNVYLPLILR